MSENPPKAKTPHTPTKRPVPMAVLDVVEVTRAVEEYIMARRPDLFAKIQAHGLRMTENGHFVWELHGARLSGVERVEASLDP
jgi:hypothetical protein